MPEKQVAVVWRTTGEETEGKGEDPEPDQDRDQKEPDLTSPLGVERPSRFSSPTSCINHRLIG